MPHNSKKSHRLWHTVDWLPGYLVHKHKKDLSTSRITILGSLLEINKKRSADEKLDFPVIFTPRFTLFKEEHAQVLDNLLPKQKEFNRADGEFDERTQAKLAFELRTKITGKYASLLAEIRNSPVFVEHSRHLLKKILPESFNLKKEPIPAVATRTITKPFHYFGNSTNYMENIIKILDVSDGFTNAGTVRDVTCGSCILTFYLASKYPNKKYIASDINGEIINALNYIKQTDMAVIRSLYIAYHNRVFTLPPGE